MSCELSIYICINIPAASLLGPLWRLIIIFIIINVTECLSLMTSNIYTVRHSQILFYDLFQVNIVSDPSCRCGANREDSYHFFFDCSHYSNIRHTLFQNLNWLPTYCVLDLTLLTCGNPTLSYEQNGIMVKHVFEYIKRSERFLVV